MEIEKVDLKDQKSEYKQSSSSSSSSSSSTGDAAETIIDDSKHVDASTRKCISHLPTFSAGLNPESAEFVQRVNIEQNCVHGLLAAVHMAFTRRQTLTLTPRDLLLAVVQGFSAMSCAPMVMNSGAITVDLGLQGAKLAANALRDVSSKLQPALKGGANIDLVKLAAFSHPADETARLASQMGWCENLFTVRKSAQNDQDEDKKKEPEFAERCGIPRIRLLGTATDFTQLGAILSLLPWADSAGRTPSYMEAWRLRVVEIHRQLMSAVEGKADLDFWRNIYSVSRLDGVVHVSGWITQLFPVVTHEIGGHHIVNPLLQFNTKDVGSSKTYFASLHLESLPSGLTWVDVNDYRKQTSAVPPLAGRCKLAAGFAPPILAPYGKAPSASQTTLHVKDLESTRSVCVRYGWYVWHLPDRFQFRALDTEVTAAAVVAQERQQRIGSGRLDIPLSFVDSVLHNGMVMPSTSGTVITIAVDSNSSSTTTTTTTSSVATSEHKRQQPPQQVASDPEEDTPAATSSSSSSSSSSQPSRLMIDVDE